MGAQSWWEEGWVGKTQYILSQQEETSRFNLVNLMPSMLQQWLFIWLLRKSQYSFQMHSWKYSTVFTHTATKWLYLLWIPCFMKKGSRDITLQAKVRVVKAVVFPVFTYKCESWTIKKAGWRRIDAFELWCWGKLLRVPWTARKSNQSVLKEINPKYSLKGVLLKLQYFGHLMRRANSLEKILMLGKIEGRKRRGQQRMRWLDDIPD